MGGYSHLYQRATRPHGARIWFLTLKIWQLLGWFLKALFTCGLAYVIRHTKQCLEAPVRWFNRVDVWVGYHARECVETIGRFSVHRVKAITSKIAIGAKRIGREVAHVAAEYKYEAQQSMKFFGRAIGRAMDDANPVAAYKRSLHESLLFSDPETYAEQPNLVGAASRPAQPVPHLATLLQRPESPLLFRSSDRAVVAVSVDSPRLS